MRNLIRVAGISFAAAALAVAVAPAAGAASTSVAAGPIMSTSASPTYFSDPCASRAFRIEYPRACLTDDDGYYDNGYYDNGYFDNGYYDNGGYSDTFRGGGHSHGGGRSHGGGTIRGAGRR